MSQKGTCLFFSLSYAAMMGWLRKKKGTIKQTCALFFGQGGDGEDRTRFESKKKNGRVARSHKIRCVFNIR